MKKIILIILLILFSSTAFSDSHKVKFKDIKGYKKQFISMHKKKVNRIQAITRHDNVPSIRGLEKNGFNLEGKLTKYYFDLKTNSFHNAFIFSKVF